MNKVNQNHLNRFLILIMVVFFFTSISSATARQSQGSNYYTKGKTALEAGQWTQALSIWEEGRDFLESIGQSDPRIGIAYIETVTSLKKPFYYEKACDIYLWGFTGKELKKFKDEIITEVKRIQPLLSKEESKECDRQIKENIDFFRTWIKAFWTSFDLTPGTVENERLLEHWERIGYARKNFNHGEKTPYGTDDRGLIYVKYGTPSLTKEGELNNPSEFALWLPNGYARTQLETQYSTYPKYELWIYEDIHSDDFVPYLFASAVGHPFGMINGIEELIPNKAYTNRGYTRTNSVPPGRYFQMMYYGKLRMYHRIFAQRYSELETKMMNPYTSASEFRSTRFRYQSRDKDNNLQLYAEPEKSDFTRSINEIKIIPTAIRFLNADNKPELNIISICYPSGTIETITAKDILNGVEIDQNFDVKNTLISYDNNWNEIERISNVPVSMFDNTTIFNIEHIDSQINYTLYAESFLKGTPESKRLSLRESIVQEQEIGLGKLKLGTFKPLSDNEGALEISDLVKGIALPDELLNSGFPYPVLPTDVIYPGDNLHAYIEIYHLTLNSDSKCRYSVTYRIVNAEKKNLVSRLFSGKEHKDIISQEAIGESSTRTATENIVFDVKDLKEGKYQFVVEIRDLNSNQSKQRSGLFTINKIKRK